MRTKEEIPYFSEADYRHDPALFTLECSRPAIGPYTAMASLNGIGLIGFQILVSHAIEIADRLKRELDKLEYCKVLNAETAGPTVNWWVLPKGRNAKEIFDRLEAGKLSREEHERYFAEIQRLFDKREAGLDRTVDARLSFTTSMGYNPHGIRLPAWKAVIFNPKTDEAIVDRIVQSIEEL